ncbi:MAG: hypothetical protein XD87_0130 [candidate division WS6 bacterium 36_33]|uniref:Uncharacterized protein n=1 Tax=candidate division WS6 bacterium 36_33 TaxID=1641388 RepID=A0A101GZ82_9BACT|nr:MAG: hypothetical protein XD87_0130 [candidate division WS6 bacterium 36_33]
MSPERSPIETDQNLLHSKIYDRAIEILKYENANPELDWKDNPELVYIDLQDNGEEWMVRKIDLENNGDLGGLNLTLFYLPSDTPFNKFKKIQLADCALYSFRLEDEEKEKEIRSLTHPIGMTTYKYRDPDPEEVQKILDQFSTTFNKKEKNLLKKILNKS